MIPQHNFQLPVGLLLIAGLIRCCLGQENKVEPEKDPVASQSAAADHLLPLADVTSFLSGIADWELIDDGWRFDKRDNSEVLSLHKKKSNFKPKHRSPLHLALLKEIVVSDFELDVRILSTHEDYPHRDACLFFGYQSPTEFYYVHLGKTTDPHANQIFIVNNADRTKISLTTTDGTPWDDQWHNVRVARNVTTGDIKVYFDDMDTPIMTANDKTFTWGRIGVGSFDDTADFDDLVLHGKVVEKPANKE